MTTTESICVQHGTPNRELVFSSMVLGAKLYVCDACEAAIDRAVWNAAVDELVAYSRESVTATAPIRRGVVVFTEHAHVTVPVEQPHVHGCAAIASGDPNDCTCLSYGMRRRRPDFLIGPSEALRRLWDTLRG